MNNAKCVLLDTETTGLSTPVFGVELAAKRMRRLYETLQLEIFSVLEALGRLRDSLE